MLRHAQLMIDAGYEVSIITGSGAQFDDRIPVQVVPEIGSRNADVLKVKQQLDAGQVTSDFEQLRNRILETLRSLLTDVDVLIAHNVFTLHKNLPLTTALRNFIDTSPPASAKRPRSEAETGRPLRVIAWHHDLAWTNELYRSQLHDGYPWNLLREAWPNVQNVTVSKSRQVELAKLYQIDPNSIEVIPPGVDPANFFRWTSLTRELVAKLDLLAADLILLLPARITQRKNIELGIRVLAELRKQTQLDARLIVSGPPGPHNPMNDAYLQSLLNLRRELKIDRAAHFLYECGQSDQLLIPDETLADLYTLADAVFFPSQQEGFGIPILEAGLARLPIFCADIPALRETGQADAHYFAPDADPIELAKLIGRELITNGAHRLQKRVRSEYFWQRIFADRIEPLLKKRAE
ncbi:MAG TPA: glycosyltransferase, partial [Anaerolineae bacterium]|nr:glycosyltransferase [Anaerolineae bacterium]